MKVQELFEADALEELEHLMMLRSTQSHISQKQAEDVQAWLRKNGYNVRANDGKPTKKSKGLGRRYLKIMSPSWRNSGWRSGKGAVERYEAERFLRDHGYRVGRWDSNVADNVDTAELPSNQRSRGPHVYFW